jgi:hypothetical protein
MKTNKSLTPIADDSKNALKIIVLEQNNHGEIKKFSFQGFF